VALTGRISWARNWPLLFLGLSIFLFLRSDPEVWPLGPNGFWVTFADPEVLLHRIFAALLVALAVFEWRVQTGGVASANIRLVFPMLIAASGALLLTHSPQPGQCERRSSGRAKSHPGGDFRGDARVVALARASPSGGESHARVVDAALARVYLADRHSLVELPRNVVGRDLVEDI
jgi:hypothetical protein